jgi:hypothetical protein
MTLLDEFNSLTTALEESGIEYAVCGGLAMAIHGFIRATKDIDIIVDESSLDRAFVAARSLGYDVEGSPLNFRDQDMKIRRISKIDKLAKILITIDFILVTDAMSDVWADRQQAVWEGGHTWVVSREGLKKMKRLAGRDIDLLDIKRLEEDDEDS